MSEPEPKKIDDQFLVGKLKAGDIDAFEALFNRYSKKLYSFSFKYVKNKEDAEEVVQNVFYKIWSNRNQLKPELSFNAYLIQIGKSIIYKMARKDQQNADYYQYLKFWRQAYHRDTEEAILLSELKRQLWKGIEEMPPKRREIFLMSRFEHLSLDEIAQKMEISKKTVKNHLTQALHDLRIYLEENELVGLILIFQLSLHMV